VKLKRLSSLIWTGRALQEGKHAIHTIVHVCLCVVRSKGDRVVLGCKTYSLWIDLSFGSRELFILHGVQAGWYFKYKEIRTVNF
jgi:hypothetical protein